MSGQLQNHAESGVNYYVVLRWTMRQRWQAKLSEVIGALHPFALAPFAITTQGESRMRSRRTSGSVEGIMSHQDSYSDSLRSQPT